MPKKENNNAQFVMGQASVLNIRHQKSEHAYALGEFIDNSVQSYLDNKKDLEDSIDDYKPKISIDFDDKKNLLEVIDNCGGISDHDAIRAFEVGAANPNKAGIGTYGMGMKVSACWYTNTWRVNTKCLKEDYAKMYHVDVYRIAKGNGDLKTKIQDKFDGYSFTHIIMENIFPDRKITSHHVKALKDHLNEQYAYFLKNRIIQIEFDGKPLKYEPPKIRVAPRYEDFNKKIQNYPEDAQKFKWETEFKFSLAKGYDVQGNVYLNEVGKTGSVKGGKQRGFGIYWKNRLITGNSTNPFMPKRSDFTTKEEQDELGIYGGANSAYNQRIEGNVYLSPNFEVTNTKDAVMWEEGHERLLIKKLKQHLENASLSEHPKAGKFNFIKEAGNAKYKPTGISKPDGPTTIDDENKPTVVLPPPDKPEKPEDPDSPDKPKDDQPKPEVTPKRGSSYEYNGVTYYVNTQFVEKVTSPLFTKTDGPNDEEDGSKSFALQINTAHPFMQRWLLNGEPEEQHKGVFMFIRALILVECSLIEDNYKNSNLFTKRLNQFIKELDMDD